MSDEILVNVTPRETRVAVVENGLLREVHIERANKRGLVGNIYKGQVSRVLPGMQATFIDIGLDRTAFLHVADICDDTDTGESGNESVTNRAITDLLHEGQEILVQVIKDPLGSKGARLTTRITIPSRYVVFMPNMNNIGVSQRIEGELERQRLKDLIKIQGDKKNNGGYIIRTAAEGVTELDLQEDIDFLHKLWDSIQQRVHEAPLGTIVYEDLPLVMRILRDFPSEKIDKVRIDSRDTFQRVLAFAQKFIPELASP